MDELIKAILTRYNAAEGATLKTATPGGMWLDQAPSISSGTYIILTAISAVDSYVMSSTVGTIDATVQFMVCNPLPGTDGLVVSAKALLRTLYHDVIMTGLTGITVLMAKCNNERMLRDPDSAGYQYVMECRYLLGR